MKDTRDTLASFTTEELDRLAATLYRQAARGFAEARIAAREHGRHAEIVRMLTASAASAQDAWRDVQQVARDRRATTR